MKQLATAATCAALLLGATAAPAAAGRLEDVRARDTLRCGVLAGSAGQSVLNDRGEWTGFDVDYCRALAAAVLGDPAKVEFRPAGMGQTLGALKSGELDVFGSQFTYTISRETELGYRFVGPTMYSGLTFMVPKALKVSKIADLNGATICLQAGSLSEELVPDYFRARGLAFKPLSVGSVQQIYSLFDSGRCDAVTTDKPTLVGRVQERKNPADYMVLGDYYAKSYTGPIVRGGDDVWVNIARWTHYAMVTAEELGVTQANVEAKKGDPGSEMRRFLGVEGEIGSKMGLRNDWTVAIIKAVGNYSEVWERNFGAGSPMKLPRDENRLARDGGMIFAPSWK